MTPVDIEDDLRRSVEPMYMDVPVEQIQRRAKHRRHRQQRLIAAPLAVAVVAVALPLSLPKDHGGPVSAAAALRATASSAAEQSWTPPKPGQYWYSESKSMCSEGGGDLKSATIYLPLTSESWMAPDSSGRVEQHMGTEITFLTEQDRQAWIDAGRPTSEAGESDSWTFAPGTGAYNFGAGALTLQQLLDLPTDETKLEAMIQKAAHSAGPSPTEETWAIFTDLAPTPLSPAARAALFRVVAANVPDVHYLGPTTDPLGREGVAVARDKGVTTTLVGQVGVRDVVIYDPVTGQLLATQTVATKADPGGSVPVGTTIEQDIIVRSGWVDSTTERPA